MDRLIYLCEADANKCTCWAKLASVKNSGLLKMCDLKLVEVLVSYTVYADKQCKKHSLNYVMYSRLICFILSLDEYVIHKRMEEELSVSVDNLVSMIRVFCKLL